MCRFLLGLWVVGTFSLAAARGADDLPGTGFTIGVPAPSWVKPLDPDTVPLSKSTEIEGGLDYILVDCQQLAAPRTDFSHYTQRVANQHGLEDGSEIRIDYDPSCQGFAMNWLKIKRDGVWQNRLRDEKFQVLHREENLDSQMLDGRLSVVCHLQDIRVGDEIDYAYTITGANPVFHGKFIDSFSTTWSSPVHLFRHQLILPPGRTVAFKDYGYSLEPTRTETANHGELLTWQNKEVPAFSEEDDTPSWYDSYGWVEISEFQSWKEVVDWALSIYPFTAPLSKELQEKVAQIAKDHAGDEDRALAVIRLVQDDVRYLGIEMGASSHQPNPPAQVYGNRFGDCKDKALLCVALLRTLGIEAYPALVNTDYLQETGKQLPSPFAFDHVIVQAVIDHHPYWIDTTRSDQRGLLKDFYIDDFKQALLIKEGNDALTPIERSPASLSREKIEDLYTVKSVEAPVSLEVHSVFQGERADSERSTFAQSSVETVQKDCLTYYANFFPKIKTEKPLRYQDFPNDNRFETWESYSVPDLWKRETPTSEWKAVFRPTLVSDAIGTAPSPQRKSPYHIGDSYDIAENIEVHLFENWNVSSTPSPVVTPYFTLSDDPSVDGSIVHFNYHYQSLVADVLPKDIADYHDAVEKTKNNLDYNLTYLPPSPQPKQPAPTSFQPNWLAFTMGFLALVIFFYIAFRIYGQRPGLPLPLSPAIAAYEGIGGWLLVVIFGYLFGIGDGIKLLVSNYASVWDIARWSLLTVPGNSAYNPVWAPALLFEILFHLYAVVFSILALLLLWKRRASLPGVMIWLLSVSLIASLIDDLLVHHLPSALKLTADSNHDLVKAAVHAAIWIPYFLVSKRVKATFRF